MGDVGDGVGKDIACRVLGILPVSETVKAEAENGVEIAVVERFEGAPIMLGVGDQDSLGGR